MLGAVFNSNAFQENYKLLAYYREKYQEALTIYNSAAEHASGAIAMAGKPSSASSAIATAFELPPQKLHQVEMLVQDIIRVSDETC